MKDSIRTTKGQSTIWIESPKIEEILFGKNYKKPQESKKNKST